MSIELVDLAAGTADRRAARAVFLHGYACSAADWRPAVETMADDRYLLIDFPGHGSQAGAGTATFDELVSGTARLLSSLPAPTTLVGHSMGGMVAMALAAEHPGLLRSLVLVDAFPYLPAVVEVFGGAEDPENDPFGYGSVIDRHTPAGVQQQVRAEMAAGVLTAGTQLHADLMQLDLRPALGSLHVPALAIIGDRHRDPSPDVRDRWLHDLGLDLLPSLHTELVSSHHFVMLERPTPVARHIEEFLLDQEITPKGKS